MTLLGKNENLDLFGFKTARVTVYLPALSKPEESKPRDLRFSDQQENLHNVQSPRLNDLKANELIL